MTRVFVPLLGLMLMLFSSVPMAAFAQQDISPEQIKQLIKGATPEELKKLRQRGFPIPGQDDGTTPVSQPPQQPAVILPPEGRSKAALASSTLESVFSTRAGQPLQQFGYDQVGIGGSVSIPQTGTVQDDYVLGPGDEINVVLRGQENSEFSASVDRNGTIVLPKTGPVQAAGKTLGDFRRDLITAIQRAYVSTQAYISVGQLRQVTVMVAGEVANPGMRILTGLSNPLDAILLSGGIKKSGSLRDIQLVRQGNTIKIDLYGVLTKRNSSGLINLQDGDRVFVPPIGATVAVSGYVRRPGIYEMPAGQSAIRARELIDLSSGVVLRGATTASVLRILPDGKSQFYDISGQANTAIRDGEILIVKSAVNIAIGRVTLKGAVRTPGIFAIEKFKRLRQILTSSDSLKPGAFVLFGFIDRINQKTQQHEAVPFSPLHVLAGKEDVKLETDDTVYVLNMSDVQNLLTPMREQTQESHDTRAAQAVATEIRAQSLSNASTVAGPGSNAAASGDAAAGDSDSATAAATTADDSMVATAGAQFGNKLTDFRFDISGAVHKPGTYLAAQNTTLEEALSVLGGLTDDVDLTNFEITSIVIDNKGGKSVTERKLYPATEEQFASIVLRPYDQLSFRHVYSDRDQGVVSIEGQVRYPGQYSILRTEKLSSLLKRSGGLTEAAYPYGTVFLRNDVALREEAAKRKMVSDIRSQLFAAMMRPTSAAMQAPSAEVLMALQSLLSQIEKQPSLGRVSFIADPELLAAHPERDPVLQPGDRIVVPKIPSSISVLGEVMQPGAYPAEDALSANDYIKQAGGYTEFADTSRVVVVMPDGRAHVKEDGWFGIGGERLPSGTVIVVARDVTGVTFHQFVIDVTQIVSQLATSAAALAVLTTNVK
jgi:polysaccharide biosynthesis/export protein